MKYSNLIADMIAEGATPEMILVAVRAIERQEENALERRRAADRTRQERYRLSRDKTLGNVSHAPSRSHVRVEDKTLTTDTEQQEEKNSAPASPSPRQHLESVLDAEHAEAILDHRKRIKAPLGRRGAQLMAKELAKCPDPNAAADMIVLRGWRGFEAAWLTDPARQRAGPFSRPEKPDHFQNYARELNGKDRDDRGDSGHWDDAQGLPLRTIEHH